VEGIELGYRAGGEVLDDSPVDMRLGGIGDELATMYDDESGGVGSTKLSSSSSGESYSTASSARGWWRARELSSVAVRGLSIGVGGTTTVDGSCGRRRLGRCGEAPDGCAAADFGFADSGGETKSEVEVEVGVTREGMVLDEEVRPRAEPEPDGEDDEASVGATFGCSDPGAFIDGTDGAPAEACCCCMMLFFVIAGVASLVVVVIASMKGVVVMATTRRGVCDREIVRKEDKSLSRCRCNVGKAGCW